MSADDVTSSARVLQLWWEGDELHVITEDGLHTAFTGVSMGSRVCVEGDPEMELVPSVDIFTCAKTGRIVKEDIIPPNLEEELDAAVDTLRRLSETFQKFRESE